MDNYKGKRMLERVNELTTFDGGSEEKLEDREVVLFENVQFIYELALAEMELKAMGVEFDSVEGARKFRIKDGTKETNRLIKRLGYFQSIGNKHTDYYHIIKKNTTKSVNQYLTHWIYPYKGKFHPQMIRGLLNIIGLQEGDTVLAPFSGSGTTALEAQLLGVNVIGIDVSPLCIAQGKVKTESIFVLPKILEMAETILKSTNMLDSERTDLKEAIEGIKDDKVKNFYRMARLVAVSDEARRGRNFIEAFKRNLDLMTRSVKDYSDIVSELRLSLGKVDIKLGDARKLDLATDSIDGIITSPPYSIALDYVSNDAHALEALGYDTKKIREEFIGVRGAGTEKVLLYDKDMEQCITEMYRVLKPGKMAAIVIGNATYQGKEVKTVEYIQKIAMKLGFVEVKNMNKIIFGLYNVMKKENILIFRKE